jgi:hypothetical protein
VRIRRWRSRPSRPRPGGSGSTPRGFAGGASEKGERVGDCIVALLECGVVAFKFGGRWSVRFPKGAAPGVDAATTEVGRAGLEPATYGLKELTVAEEVRGVNPDLILRGSLVRRVLDFAARHDPATADEMMRAMRALASTVLAADEVRLAREVLEGGRFAAVKAVELAERLLTPAARTIPMDATLPNLDVGLSSAALARAVGRRSD